MSKARTPIGRRPGNEGRKTFWLLVGAASLACCLGLFHTWTRVAVLDRSYQVGKARAENERLAIELEKLKLEVATLQGTVRVDREARVKLGLAKPPPERVVVLEAAGAQASRARKATQLAHNDLLPALP